MAHYTPYFLLLQAWAVAVAAVDKPNILFILTDDQDWHMQSLVNDIPYAATTIFANSSATHATATKVHGLRGNALH